MSKLNQILIGLDNLDLTVSVQKLSVEDKKVLENLFEEYIEKDNLTMLLLKVPTLSEPIQEVYKVIIEKVPTEDLLAVVNSVKSTPKVETATEKVITSEDVKEVKEEQKLGKNPVLSKPFYAMSKGLDNLSKTKNPEKPQKLATAGAMVTESIGDILKMASTGVAPTKVSNLNERKPETVGESLKLTGKLITSAVKEKTPTIVNKAKELGSNVENKMKDTFSHKNPSSYLEEKPENYYKDKYEDILNQDINGTAPKSTEKPTDSYKQLDFLEKLKARTQSAFSDLTNPLDLHDSILERNLKQQQELQERVKRMSDNSSVSVTEEELRQKIKTLSNPQTSNLRESANRRLQVEATTGFSTDSSLNITRYNQLKKVVEFLDNLQETVTKTIIKADGTELEIDAKVTFKIKKVNAKKAVINLVFVNEPTAIIDTYEYVFETDKVTNDYIALGKVIVLAIPNANLDTDFEDLQALEPNVAINFIDSETKELQFGTYTDDWSIEHDGKIEKVISDTWAFKSKL